MRLLSVVAGLALLGLSQAALAQDAAGTFDLLYGKDMNRVAATKDTADDLALARQMLDAARAPKTEASLVAILCDKACELAIKDPKGGPLAIEAVEVAAEKVPGRKAERIDRILAVRQQLYAAAKMDAKAKAGEELVAAIAGAAEEKTEAGDLDAAAALCRRGLTVTASAAAKDDLRARLADLGVRQKAVRQAADLKTKVEANPGDAASRQELVRLCLVEFDNPGEAAKYLAEGVDEALRRYVPGAAKPVSDAPELACIEMADWYASLGDKAACAASKAAMLSRAAGYYKRFLDLHTADDASRAKAAFGAKKVQAALEKLGKSAAGAGSDATGWVEVLRFVDLLRDLKTTRGDPDPIGKWDVASNGLHVIGSHGGQAEIPVAPQGSYQLRLKFRWNVAGERVWVTFPVAVSCASVCITNRDCWVQDDAVRGKKEGETLVRSGAPDVNREYTLEVKVVPGEVDSTIEISLDGTPLLTWRGPAASLRPPPTNSGINPAALAVGCRFADVTFHSLQLRMIAGKAVPLRTLTPPRPAKPVPARR